MTAPITETLATNLAYFMDQKGLVQSALASKSGLGQTTIGLYLNPKRRNDTASGCAPSPTLAKVSALAAALGVELWELLRPLTPAQRDLIRSVDAVIAERVGDEAQPIASASAAPAKRTRQVRAAATPLAKRRRA